MSNTNQKIRKLTANGLLAAVICIVSFLPLRTMGLEITFSMVPVAIGACLFGPSSGAILGAVFGTVSFLQCFGYSVFGTALLEMNFFYTLLICIPTRAAAGFLAGLLAKALKKVCKTNLLGYTAGCIAAPVLNTVFFMSAICLFFYNTDYIRGFAQLLGSNNVFTFILLFVGINGLVEIIAGFIIALPVSKALSKAIKV